MANYTERNIERLHNMFGGNGEVILEHLVKEEEINGKCGLFASVTLNKDCSLGYHEHHGESETYYIISGEGVYDNNGVIIPVVAGDRFVCNDGEGHALKNIGENPLVFIALIMKH